VYGTDLGSSFAYQSKLYFLFGDTRTHPVNKKDPECIHTTDRDGGPSDDEEVYDNYLFDTVAFTTDSKPDEEKGIKLEFLGHPKVPGITHGGSEVPVEGIGIGNDMYVFFATDSPQFADTAIFTYSTKSILAKSSDGINFGSPLYTFSRIDIPNTRWPSGKFINVSVVRASSRILQNHSEEEILLIWGTGRFRASDVYLAYMPLKDIDKPTSLEPPDTIRYFSGYDRNNKPDWKKNESDAVSLFCAGNVGELSVRWNNSIERWIMLYNSDNPPWIIARTSKKPWGPWTQPMVIFDPWKDGGYVEGHGGFMHWPPDHDKLSDCWRPNDPGGAYGPSQIEQYSTDDKKSRSAKIYFTMSTWNPYQVVLMSAVISNNE
jgi:hypothetical protein